jgi:acetyltransferase-like isoleucine patch superfamily enzyme
MAEPSGRELWLAKRDWYDRNHTPEAVDRIDRHMVEAGAYIRHPIEGEILEGLDSGRLTVGEGSHFEPGCWITLAPEGRISIGRDCWLNRNVMLACLERIEIGDHVMFANGCFVGDSDHRYDDRSRPITEQGFAPRGPVKIGSNCWFGVNCVVTGGLEIGERCVIGANSVVTQSLPAGVIAAGAPAKVLREIEFRDGAQE